MEQVREVEHEVTVGMFGAAAANPPGGPHLVGPDRETATALLRRCTALATRARVDLLAPGRGGAADELLELLEHMQSWEGATLDAPDPIMIVLAAAALQDLRERLSVVEGSGGGATDALTVRTGAVLSVLHAVMDGARVDVPA